MLLYAEVMLTELIVDFKIGTTSSIPDIFFLVLAYYLAIDLECVKETPGGFD
jgi:hypothetical protein